MPKSKEEQEREAGQAGSGEGAGSPEPKYLTEEALQEALSGFASQFQEYFDGIHGQVSQLGSQVQNMQRRSAQPRQPQQPILPELPDFHEMLQNQDSYSLRRMFEQMNNRYESRLNRAMQMIERINSQRQQEQTEKMYYDHFMNQVNAAVKQFPRFADPQARDYFEHQVAAAIANSGGNVRSVNVLQIAKGMDTWLGSLGAGAAGAAAAAAGAEGGGEGGEPPAPPAGPGAAPKGTASKPTEKTADTSKITDWESFDKAADEELPKIEEMRAAEGGMEEME